MLIQRNPISGPARATLPGAVPPPPGAAAPPGQQPLPQQPPPDDGRARLAEAILKATGGGQPQPVQHPTQAIGNAMQQIAAANVQRQRPRPPMAAARQMRVPGQVIRPPQRPRTLKPGGW